MLKLRLAAAATVVALIAAFASMGQASAATNGVGTTQSSSSLIDIALGDAGKLLRLQILPDEALATIDPANGAKTAFSKLSALKVSSSVLPLNLTIPATGLESRTTNGPNEVNGPALNLNSLGVPAAIASGSVVPIKLSSAVDALGARAGIDTKLANLGLIGGLLGIDSVTSTLGAAGAPATSDGLRGLSLKTISVLDLDTLLKGLGIDLNNLPITAVSSILDALNLGVPGLASNAVLGDTVSVLQTTINGLVAKLALPVAGGGLGSILSDLTGGTDNLGPLNGALQGLGFITTPLGAGSPLSLLTTLLATVQDTLLDLLNSAVGVLQGANLLEIGGIDLGAVTKAVSDPKASKADVVGKINGVKVGGLNLGNIDLTGTLSQVTGVLNQLSGVLNGVLSPLGLDDLIKVGLFEKATTNGVSTSGGYVRSLAGITGLNISIKPLTDLLDLPALGGIGNVIDLLPGGELPLVGSGATSMLGLTNVLNGLIPGTDSDILGALLGGASIKVASVQAGSTFAAPGSAATPAPVPQLPRTGANTTAFMVIGMLMVAGALVGRRFIPALVKSDS